MPASHSPSGAPPPVRPRPGAALPGAGRMAVAALGLFLCVLPATSATQAATPPDAQVDAHIQPGDDFFAYANGGWLATSTIPPGKDRWTVRNELDVRTRAQIDEALQAASAAPAGSLARKVWDFKAAYLDEDAIEQHGTSTIEPMLAAIDHVTDADGLTRLLGAGMPADVDPLNLGVYESAHPLGLSVEEGNNGERNYVAFLLQGGLGLPDRDDYFGIEPAKVALRARYQTYIAHQLALAGLDQPEQRAQRVMALETALAQSHASRATTANDHNADTLWTRADFVREAPGMDWATFFAAAGLARQDAFVVWQPGAVTGLATLVASQPLDAWKDYLRFHVVDRFADVLPRAFAQAARDMRSAGSGTPAPRAQAALEATQAALAEPLGRLYVERFFPPASKSRAQAIVADVLAALRARVAAATWMTPATRRTALAKLDAVYFGMGYPERWTDYSDLVIDPKDAAGNRRRLVDWNRARALARLGQAVDLKEWLIPPQMVGAVLIFQQNSYNFPAALLQPPKFDPAASDATNYGAIGAIVGHELTHFIDTLGAEYETSGRNRRWWTDADAAAFAALCEPLQRQFDAYRPFPDLAVDGKRTLSENVADLGGLVSAFDAYRHSLGARAADPSVVHELDRQFFIAYARAWRSRLSEPALRAYVAGNDHAPDAYRIATVRNLDAWYEAFDVRPGQRLYLAPAARVHIW